MCGDHAEQVPAATEDKTPKEDSAAREQSRDKTPHSKAQRNPHSLVWRAMNQTLTISPRASGGTQLLATVEPLS